MAAGTDRGAGGDELLSAGGSHAGGCDDRPGRGRRDPGRGEMLARSVERLLDEEGGFEPRQALTARLMLGDTQFIDGRAEKVFVDTLLDRVRGLRGVQAAGVGSMLPPGDAPLKASLAFSSDSSVDDHFITLSFASVTDGYFAALGIPLHGGRRFDAGDDLADVSPVILSETAARSMYPARESVGRSMGFAVDPVRIARGSPIVAVVGDVKYDGLDAPRAGSV